MAVQLIIDYRETALIEKLKQSKIEHTVQNLEIGDIQIRQTQVSTDTSVQVNSDESVLVNSDEKPVVIIERKTVSDYLQSLGNKHLKNQLIRMKQSDAKLILLVEGNLQPSFGNPSLQFKELATVNHLYNSMLNRIFVDQIPVIRSENLSETVIWLQKIIEKLPEIVSGVSRDKPKDYLETVIKSKKSDNLDPSNCYLLQLSQIPGVSLNMAKSISQSYPTLVSLINAYIQPELTVKQQEGLLSKLQVGQRKIGPVVSQRIYQFLIRSST